MAQADEPPAEADAAEPADKWSDPSSAIFFSSLVHISDATICSQFGISVAQTLAQFVLSLMYYCHAQVLDSSLCSEGCDAELPRVILEFTRATPVLVTCFCLLANNCYGSFINKLEWSMLWLG